MSIDFSQVNLSFAGCGFLCVYHAGVCAALKEYAPQLTRNRIYGASAGSIAAAGLICNVCISEATSAILQVVCEARAGTLKAMSPTFDLMGLVRDGLHRILPDNAHELCSGKLYISLTRNSDGKNVLVSEFASKAELIQAIVCSCFIPVFCGFLAPEFREEKYIDGGFSDNQPMLDSKTITISPFSGESDICPLDLDSGSILGCVYYNSSIRFTTENLYRFSSCFLPPSQDICSKICRQGFADALRFLTKNSITPCAKCLTVQSNLLPLPVYKGSRAYSLASEAGSPCTRRRLDSECEVCMEKLEPTLNSEATEVNALFPAIMQKTLNETQAAEYRYLSYLLSFRVVRWSVKLMSPVITPLEYTLVVLKMLKFWLDSSSKKDFLMERLHTIADFILKEVEEYSLLGSTKFSCQLSINKIGGRTKSQARLGGVKRKESVQFREDDDLTEYAAQLDDDDSVCRVIDYTKHHEAILHYYYTDTSNQVQICEIFDMQRPRKQSRGYFSETTQFSISGQKPKKHLDGLTEEEGGESEPEFILESPPPAAKQQLQNNSSSSSIKQTYSSPSQQMSKNKNEGMAACAQDLTTSHNSNKGEDSGVNSLAEESPVVIAEVKKRDACCSPVRHFSNTGIYQKSSLRLGAGPPGPSSHAKHFGAVRRHTTLGVSTHSPSSVGSAVNIRKHMSSFLSSKASLTGASFPNRNSKKVPGPFSSDSDADLGDELFVANPRKRTTSNEYDGEPEPSDTDPGHHPVK